MHPFTVMRMELTYATCLPALLLCVLLAPAAALWCALALASMTRRLRGDARPWWCSPETR
jgi:hypothetical protein